MSGARGDMIREVLAFETIRPLDGPAFRALMPPAEPPWMEGH